MRVTLSALVAFVSMTFAPGTTDLAEVLAPPPSSDYADAAADPHALSGPFDSHQYAEWLGSTAGDATAIQHSFDENGFSRGYARSWSALSQTPAQIGFSRRNYLIETVEEYSSDAGARWRYEGVVNYAKSSDNGFVRQIETLVPGAFGAVTQSGAEFFVIFVKGNDTYIVRMESNADDMTSLAVKQAQVQFTVAPAFTIPPPRSTSTPRPLIAGGSNSAQAKAIIAESILGVILVGLVLMLAVRARRAA